MTLEQAIHEHWFVSPDLNGLLPAERLFTGRSLDTSSPYATLARERTQPVCRTSSGDVDEVTLRVHVWHDRYEAGCAVAQAVRAAFSRRGFDLGGGVLATGMRFIGRADVLHDDGIWQFTLRFSIRSFEPRRLQS
jgi:hypothetical protein